VQQPRGFSGRRKVAGSASSGIAADLCVCLATAAQGKETPCVIVIGDPRVSDVGCDAVWELRMSGRSVFALIDTLTAAHVALLTAESRCAFGTL